MCVGSAEAFLGDNGNEIINMTTEEIEEHPIATAITDLITAVKDVMLGNIEYVVIEDAVDALIENWNDNDDTGESVDEEAVLQWYNRKFVVCGAEIRLPEERRLTNT